jgi:MFS family permease
MMDGRSQETERQQPPDLTTRNVWALTVTSFLTDVSSEMIFNLLPLFLFDVLGVRTPLIGLIEGVAESTASLMKVISGWFSDRIGRRKGLAVLGYSLSTLAKPFLYVASGWGTVLGVRFADRLGKGVRTAPRDALLAGSVGEERRGWAFGLHRAGDTAGAVVGLAIALAVLLASRGKGLALDRGTFQLIVLLSLVPAVLAVLALAIGARDVSVQGERRQAPSLSLKQFDRPFLFFLGTILVFTLGNSSDAFLILRAQNVGLTAAGVLGMMLVFNLVYAGLSGPAGSLSDRWGRRWMLVAGWGLYCLVYVGFAKAGAAWQVVGLMAVYGAFYGLTEGAARAFVADLVRPDQRGTAYGVYHATVGLAAFPASLIAGVMWQGVGAWSGWGASAPFWFGAVLALVATALLMAMPIRPEPKVAES